MKTFNEEKGIPVNAGEPHTSTKPCSKRFPVAKNLILENRKLH